MSLSRCVRVARVEGVQIVWSLGGVVPILVRTVMVAGSAAILLTGSVFGAEKVEAHHSWKCPPEINSKVIGTEGNALKLSVTARNTCGCKIRFRVCPSDSDSGCSSKWIGPGQVFEGTVKTITGKASYDWGTHSNDAPCT